MDWLRVLVDTIVWTVPAVLAVVTVGPQDLQRLVLPLFLLLVLLLTVGAVIRYWPTKEN